MATMAIIQLDKWASLLLLLEPKLSRYDLPPRHHPHLRPLDAGSSHLKLVIATSFLSFDIGNTAKCDSEDVPQGLYFTS